MDTNAAFFLFLAVAAASMWSFIAVAAWAGERRKERQAFYRSEVIKKLAESPGSESILEFLRETERRSARRLREGLRLSGLVVMAAGIGLTVFLQSFQQTNDQAGLYLVGVIPLLVGAALFVYAQFMAPRD